MKICYFIIEVKQNLTSPITVEGWDLETFFITGTNSGTTISTGIATRCQKVSFFCLPVMNGTTSISYKKAFDYAPADTPE